MARLRMRRAGLLAVSCATAAASAVAQGGPLQPPSFQGWPTRVIEVNRHWPPEKKREAYPRNGYRWPVTDSFVGWPPRPDGEVPASFVESRDQLEAAIRRIPTSIHHRKDDWEELVQSTLMPRFTRTGFKVVDAPQEVWKALQAHYQAAKRDAPVEKFGGSRFFTDERQEPRIIRDQKQQELNRAATTAVKGILEEWSGVKLHHTSTYGVRVYQNGSTLQYHIDKPDTHVVSLIFHIDHDLDEPWPLEIEDHFGNIHAVSPKPGQMVLYESAKQFHGRLTPMRGRDYGSVFIHFKPDGWNWTRMDVVAAVPPDSMEMQPESGERKAYLAKVGESPVFRYRRKYYESRGLPVLDFIGHDRLALPVQNAAIMTPISEDGGSPETLEL